MSGLWNDAGAPCVALLFVIFGLLTAANRREIKQWWRSRFWWDV